MSAKNHCGILLLITVLVTTSVVGGGENTVQHRTMRAMLDRSFESFGQEIADLDKRNHAGIDTTLSEDTSPRRRKRVAGIIGKVFFTGLDAVKFLVAGAQKLPFRDKCCRDYQKKGTFFKAARDFKRVNPAGVSTVQLPGGAKGIVGVVDDKTLLLRRAGEDGNPVLEIIDSIKHSNYQRDRKNWPLSDPPIERITYID